MIGNDLVYLPAWPQRSGSRLQRFRAKVFTAAEQVLITSSENPHVAEAWLWSCKEAAYKVWFKSSRRREFAPKRFAFNGKGLRGDALRVGLETTLQINHQKYFLISAQEGDYIHTLASDQSPDELKNCETWRGPFRPERLDYCGHSLLIEKDGYGVPLGLWQGEKLDLSLSHDGAKYYCVFSSLAQSVSAKVPAT